MWWWLLDNDCFYHHSSRIYLCVWQENEANEMNVKYSRIHVHEYTEHIFAGNPSYRDRKPKYISKSWEQQGGDCKRWPLTPFSFPGECHMPQHMLQHMKTSYAATYENVICCNIWKPMYFSDVYMCICVLVCCSVSWNFLNRFNSETSLNWLSHGWSEQGIVNP